MEYQSINERGAYTRKVILKFIIKYIQEHGYSPSVSEIGDGVGLKSKSSVHSHMKRMLEDGTLETDHGIGTARTIRVPGYKFIKE